MSYLDKFSSSYPVHGCKRSHYF